MDKRELKRAYVLLHQELSGRLAHSFRLADSMPDDEYTGEASMILARLDEASSADSLADIVREVFVHQFNEEFVASFTAYGEVADWLWETCRERGFLPSPTE